MQTGVITGCLRISKESIFTGLNNLEVVSVLSDFYSEYFGFTQNEMDAMLAYYGLESKTNTVKDWYNGYLFGETVVYNPLSAVLMVSAWVKNINRYPEPYWVNTSGNDIIHDMIDNMDSEAKAGLETLMAGGTVSSVINEYVTYDDIYSAHDNLWNFLLFTGYLKKTGDERQNADGELTLDLSIPNIELKYIYKTKIQEWFNTRVAREDTAAFIEAIINGNTEILQEELSSLLVESISYMDSEENNYHGFMTGVLTILARQNGYLVKSNRESGDGRYDAVLYRVNGKKSTAVIFEFKVVKKFDQLPTACEDALKQIEEKNYTADWENEGFENIIKYGIGFYKKRCAVRKG
ncbi:ATPase AAA [Fibrobacteres bacterium R8-0-B4]